MNKKGIFNTVSIIVDILATIIAIIVILNLAFGNTTSENYDSLYMSESTVIDISSDNIVTVETIDNEIFSFKGNGTWLVNDGVVLLMDNNGTTDVKDDKVIDVNYNMQ